MFVLAFIPAVGLMGAAIDYSRANSTRTDMQAALGSTALMLSRNGTPPTTLSAGQLQQNATDYFTTVFIRPGTRNIQVTTTYDSLASSMTFSASASIPTDFMGLLGLDRIDLATSTTVSWGSTIAGSADAR